MKVSSMIVLIVFLAGCASTSNLKPPIFDQTKSINNYKFVAIPYAQEITSRSKQLSPDEVIEGMLLKKGIVRINEIPEKIKNKTLISKFAISGTRTVNFGMGYTMEVTIILMDSRTLDFIYSCTAEGIGATEVDDIRAAITNCMSGLK